MNIRSSVGVLSVVIFPILVPSIAQAWTTECKDMHCAISINVNDETKKHKLMTVALLIDKDGTSPSLLLTTPLGVALEPGVRLNLGQRNISLKFKVCYPDGCQAFLPLAAADLTDLRAAASVDVRLFAQSSDKLLSAKIDLSGLGTAIDEVVN